VSNQFIEASGGGDWLGCGIWFCCFRWFFLGFGRKGIWKILGVLIVLLLSFWPISSFFLHYSVLCCASACWGCFCNYVFFLGLLFEG